MVHFAKVGIRVQVDSINGKCSWPSLSLASLYIVFRYTLLWALLVLSLGLCEWLWSNRCNVSILGAGIGDTLIRLI
jgi:hypothetical protein